MLGVFGCRSRLEIRRQYWKDIGKKGEVLLEKISRRIEEKSDFHKKKDFLLRGCK